MTFAEAYEFLLSHCENKLRGYEIDLEFQEKRALITDDNSKQYLIDGYRVMIERWKTCVRLMEKEKNFHLRMLEKME